MGGTAALGGMALVPNNQSINPGYASVGNAKEGIDVSYLQAPIVTPAYDGAYPILNYKNGELFETGGGISLIKKYGAEKLLNALPIPEDRTGDSLILQFFKETPKYSLESVSSYYNPKDYRNDFSVGFGNRYDDDVYYRWISDMGDIDNQASVFGSKPFFPVKFGRDWGLDIPILRDDIVQINDYMNGSSDSIVISAEGYNEFNRVFIAGPDYKDGFANNDGYITLSGEDASSLASMYQGVLSVSSKYELVNGRLLTQESFFPESFEKTQMRMQTALTGATAPMASIAGLAARVLGYDETAVAGVTNVVAGIENILQSVPLGMKINPKSVSTKNNYSTNTYSRNAGKINEFVVNNNIKANRNGNASVVVSVPAEGVVASRINVRLGRADQKGWGLEYAWKKHGGSWGENKSSFTISKNELKVLLQDPQVINTPAYLSPTSGNYIRTVNLGSTIGIDAKAGGRSTNSFTVITDSEGNLVNTFPGRTL